MNIKDLQRMIKTLGIEVVEKMLRLEYEHKKATWNREMNIA